MKPLPRLKIFLPAALVFLVIPIPQALPADPFFWLSHLKFLKPASLRNHCLDSLLPESKAACGEECALPDGSQRLISLLAQGSETLDRSDVIALLRDLEQRGTLDSSIEGVVTFVIREMKQAGASAPSKTPQEIAGGLTHMMRAELRSEGWISQQKADEFLGQKLQNLDERTGLGSLKFWSFLKEHAGASQTLFNSIDLLPRNSQGMKARLDMIEKASHSLDIFSWGWVDDPSGEELAHALILKKQKTPSLKIRILVDGAVAQQEKYNDTLKTLARNGIDVLNARVSPEPYHGMHQKGILRDAWTRDLKATPEMIMGGRNPGDDYFLDQNWSDFDIRITGNAIRDAAIGFQNLWNSSAVATNPSAALLLEQLPRRSSTPGSMNMALLQHNPDRPGEDPILLATLAILQAAEKEVTISNAYFLPSPILLAAVGAAAKRGVQVRILTNSPLSIDERALAVPMVESAKKLQAIGAKVFFKQGKTLHDKILLADSRIGMVGSYNYHPRSQWYEKEWAFVFSDGLLTRYPVIPKFLAELESRFNAAVPLDSYLSVGAQKTSAQELFFLKLFEIFRRQF
jgi:phosphatidylserine/phosphatidylglycerophosphate/cardiolipin synthase-like enzyme